MRHGWVLLVWMIAAAGAAGCARARTSSSIRAEDHPAAVRSTGSQLQLRSVPVSVAHPDPCLYCP